MFQAISRRLHLNIFTQVDKVSKWALYPYILLAALIARVVIADLSVSFYHPDEAFQYLEQAHRLVYGFGFIPWEYEFGIRSWAIPFFLASILSVCQAIGLDNPLSYTMAVKLVLCVVSLSLPISVYKISQGMLGEKAARVAFVLACFWYELLVYAHRPLPDILATYTLFSSLVFLSGERSVSRHAWFGLLMALTIVLRFQLLPVAGVLCALYVLHFQRECWPAILTFVTTIFFFGWLDYFTWGVWFSSIFLNLKLNFVYDIASYFGGNLTFIMQPV